MRFDKLTCLLLLILFSFSLFYGCSSRRTPEPKVVKEKVRLYANPAELLQKLVDRNSKIKTLRTSSAGIEFRFTDSTKGYRGADLLFAVKKAGKVYARASATGVGDIFTLISDGHKYWAEINRENEVYTGTPKDNVSLDKPADGDVWEKFTPEILSQALLIDDLKEYSHSSFAIYPDFYIISLMDISPEGQMRLRRQIWFEREGLNVRRHSVYNETGEVLTEAYLYRYINVDGFELPTFYRIERQWEKISLRLTIDEYKLNSNLRDSLFEYDEVPQDYKLIDTDKREEKDAESGES